MKLFIIAALVSVAAAGRLEHLENSYLPPDHSHGQTSFGSQGQGHFGFQGSSGSASQGFDSNAIDSAATRSQGIGAAFPGATSNQYLPPDHGPSGSHGQFSGSLSGFQGSSLGSPSFGSQARGSQSFGSQTHGSQSFGAQTRGSQYTPNQYGSASNGFGQPRYQQQYSAQSQFPATSRQYLAPKSNFQNIPQQAFDEQTGYHY